jgi:hypothetical protein
VERIQSESARRVLEAAMKDANSILSVPLPPPSTWSTLLVAQWSVGPRADGIVPVVLWDDSIADTLIFRCRAKQMKSPDLLAHLIDSLFRWDTRRLLSAQFWLRYPLVTGNTLVGAGQSGSRGQFLFGPEVVFSGFLRGDTGYIGISFVSLTPPFPFDMKCVEERFPPLRERFPHWSTEQLVAETMRPQRAEVLPDGITLRNRLLVNEAIARDDLTTTMFQDLLSRGVGNGATLGNALMPEVVRIAIEKHRVARFATALRQYLDRRPERTTTPSEADIILHALSNVAEIDLEDQAIRCLEDRTAVSGGLRYLQLRGRTQRARDAVVSLDTPDWAKQRETALAAINDRIRNQP